MVVLVSSTMSACSPLGVGFSDDVSIEVVVVLDVVVVAGEVVVLVVVV